MGIPIRRSVRHLVTTSGLLGSIVCFTAHAFAQATTPQFFFSTPGQTPTSYTQDLSSQSIAAGATVTLSVWLQYQPATTTSFYGADVFIGFDQTNLAGTSATPQNNTVTLPTNLTATTAVTNVNPALTDLSNALAGGQDSSSATSPSSAARPYGDDILLTGVTGFGPATSQPIHLFDIQLHNAALGAGGSQQIAIYSSDPSSHATTYTTYLDNGTGDATTYARPATSTILNLFQPAGTDALPEPAALPIVLLSGPFAFAAHRLRRGSDRISARGERGIP